MTKEKIQSVVQIYKTKLENLSVGKIHYPHNDILDTAEHGLEHCHGMLDEMEVFLQEGRVDKVFRWLVFIQGILWSEKIYSLEDLKNHNRP